MLNGLLKEHLGVCEGGGGVGFGFGFFGRFGFRAFAFAVVAASTRGVGLMVSGLGFRYSIPKVTRHGQLAHAHKARNAKP